MKDRPIETIESMRTFLYYCRVTGYLLDEQIDFLNKALDALEREENENTGRSN